MKKFRLLAILTALGLMAACSEAPTAPSPELTALINRAAIEDLISNYYAQFRSDTKQDFMSFFTADGRLEVNGWVVNGYDEIKDMYLQAGIIGGEEEAPKAEGAVPKGVGETLYTNLDIDLQGDKAVVKKLGHLDQARVLLPENKAGDYMPIVISDNFKLFGKVWNIIPGFSPDADEIRYENIPPE